MYFQEQILPYILQTITTPSPFLHKRATFFTPQAFLASREFYPFSLDWVTQVRWELLGFDNPSNTYVRYRNISPMHKPPWTYHSLAQDCFYRVIFVKISL